MFFEQIEIEPDSTEDEKRIAEWTKLFLFAIIFITNLIFLVTWAINFCNAIREKVRETKWLYIILFLCCRPGKYEEDAINLAQDVKRENIIEKIEEVQFYMKKMKDFYTKRIFYEGHEKFIDLLYYIEGEKSLIDLRVKKHNLYIQGEITRLRKLDMETI